MCDREFTTNGGEGMRQSFNLRVCRNSIIIIKIDGTELQYPYTQLLKILTDIANHDEAGIGNELPLANAVDRVADATYPYGLGRAFYDVLGDTTLAQGASYLAPILNIVSILKWNKINHGATYALQWLPESSDELRGALKTCCGSNN